MPFRLQEVIHRFEEGEGAGLVKRVTLVLVLLALAAAYNGREYRNFSAPDAMDAAQVARNLAEGHGFSTKFIRPLSLYLLDRRIRAKLAALPQTAAPQRRETLMNILRLKAPQPDLAHAPLYPTLLAGLMKVLPFRYDRLQSSGSARYQPEVLIGLINQVIFLAVLLMVFFLARRLFDASVAWISLVVLAASDLLWRFTLSGLSTMLLLLILLALIGCLMRLERGLREEQRGSGWVMAWAALVGVCLGAGMLTRYSFGWLALPVLGFMAAYFGQHRWRTMVVATAVFCTVVAPWLARNYNTCGQLFGTAGFALYQGLDDFPENALERSLAPDLKVASDLSETKLDRVELKDHFRKLLVNANVIFQVDLPRLTGNWVAAFFLVGLMLSFKSVGLQRLRWFVVGCLLTLVIVQASGQTYLTNVTPTVNSENLLVLLAPLVTMFGVAFFLVLLDQGEFPWPGLRAAVIGAGVLLVSAPMLFTLLPPRSFPPVEPYDPPLTQYLSGSLSQEERLMTDLPWATAWYGNRSSIWLTIDPYEDFAAINDYLAPIHALYLTQVSLDRRFQTQMIRGFDRGWGSFFLLFMLKKEVPTGFPLKYAFSDLVPEGQLLLSDRPRWDPPPK